MGTGRTCAVSPCRNSTSALNSAARATASSCPCASPSSSSCSPRRPLFPSAPYAASSRTVGTRGRACDAWVGVACGMLWGVESEGGVRGWRDGRRGRAWKFQK